MRYNHPPDIIKKLNYSIDDSRSLMFYDRWIQKVNLLFIPEYTTQHSKYIESSRKEFFDQIINELEK